MAPGEMGDQKYLSSWMTQYEGVQELQNHGGGVAPWNIGRYRFLDDKDQQIRIYGKDTKQVYPLIFYHFHQLQYLDADTVNLNIYKQHLHIDETLAKKIYVPYLKEIEEIKNHLSEQYGIRPMLRKHPGIAAGEKKSWIKRLQGKRLVELIDRVEESIIRKLGQEKDIIKLGEL